MADPPALPMTRLLTFLVLLGATALPARAQDHAVAGGVDLEAGVLGVTYIRHVEGDWVGFAVGGGLYGVGARVQRRLYEEGDQYGFRTRYLSAGVLVLPWRIDSAVATPVLATVEYGAEIVYKPLYFSGAVGGAIPLGGNINGSYLVPSVRFLFGYAY